MASSMRFFLFVLVLKQFFIGHIKGHLLNIHCTSHTHSRGGGGGGGEGNFIFIYFHKECDNEKLSTLQTVPLIRGHVFVRGAFLTSMAQNKNKTVTLVISLCVAIKLFIPSSSSNSFFFFVSEKLLSHTAPPRANGKQIKTNGRTDQFQIAGNELQTISISSFV